MAIGSKTFFSIAAALLSAFYASDPCAAEPRFSATVTRVIRGDVLELEWAGKRQRVVLYGVECPASVSDTGKEAKAFTRGLVLDTKVDVEVVAEIHDLVYVHLRLPDGTLLNRRLIEEGFATWDRVSAPRAPELESLERQARTRGVGIWYDPDAPTVDADPEAVLSENLDQFKERRALLRRIEFDMSFIRWRDFPEAERARIRAELERAATEFEASDRARVEEQAQVVAAIAAQQRDLESRFTAANSRLDELDRQEEGEVARLYNDRDLNRDRRRLELMETDREAAYEAEALAAGDVIEYINRRERYRRRIAERENELDVRAREVRVEYTARRNEESQNAFRVQAQQEQVYDSRIQAENRARQVHAMARKRAARNDTMIADIDALDRALAEEYAPETRPHPVADWEGNEGRMTGPFRVTTPLWAIDWNTFSQAGARNVSMDIFRSEDEQLVARVSNATPSYKSFKVLDTPGIYYIEIKTKAAVPYHIRIIEFR